MTFWKKKAPLKGGAVYKGTKKSGLGILFQKTHNK
jgi:hypothetical protein